MRTLTTRWVLPTIVILALITLAILAFVLLTHTHHIGPVAWDDYPG